MSLEKWWHFEFGGKLKTTEYFTNFYVPFQVTAL